MSSLWLKVFQKLAGLGTIAVIPLSYNLVTKDLETGGGHKLGLKVSEQNPTSSAPETKQPETPPMAQAIKIMERRQGEENVKDDKGCFTLPGILGSEFFMCTNMRTLEPLFFFNYVWKTRALNEVIGITYQGTWPATMKFENSQSEKIPMRLKPNFSWLQKSWKNTEFSPKHCKMTKKQDNDSVYVLTCNNPSKLESKPHWEKEIPSSQITIHKNSFDLKNKT